MAPRKILHRFAGHLAAALAMLGLTIGAATQATLGGSTSAPLADSEAGGVRRYRVAIVDAFYPGDTAFASEAERTEQLVAQDAIDVDGDGIRDPFHHGDLMAMYVAHPSIETIPYRVDSRSAKRQILRQLRTIEREVRGGHRIDAVLLAWESSTLASVFGRLLRPELAEAYKAVLRGWGDQSATWHQSYDIITALEALVATGVRVYTIAGNGGAGMVNTYSFAVGVVTVGGAEPDAEGRWISQNAFVTTLGQAAYEVRLVHDDAGRAGYDVNEDGVPDVPIGRVSSAVTSRAAGPITQAHTILKGSSFGAATALKRDVLDLVADGHRTSAIRPGAAAARDSKSPRPRE